MKKAADMWNIDGRNKAAVTLFSSEFVAPPDLPRPKSMPPGQRKRKVPSDIVDSGSTWLRREKTARRTDRQQRSCRGRNE